MLIEDATAPDVARPRRDQDAEQRQRRQHVLEPRCPPPDRGDEWAMRARFAREKRERAERVGGDVMCDREGIRARRLEHVLRGAELLLPDREDVPPCVMPAEPVPPEGDLKRQEQPAARATEPEGRQPEDQEIER